MSWARVWLIVATVIAYSCSGGDAGAAGDSPKDGATSTDERIDFGVSFSPVGFGGPADVWLANRAAFYTDRAAYGRTIAYHFGWWDAGSPRPACGTDPAIFKLLENDVSSHSFTLSVVLGWSSGTGAPELGCAAEPANNSWSNAEARAAYKQVAVAIATRFHPTYLFLGNEVNTWYLAHPDDWANWLTELADVAAAVRAASPGTQVGTTYQWEHLRGGGAHNGWSDEAQWSLIDDVAGVVDILGLTTYPYFDFDTPEAVPNDYFAEALARFPGPIAVTETAWRESAGVPYPGSPDDQAHWPALLVARIPPTRLRYATWLFFNEAQGELGPFATTGLRDTAGTPRLVDSAWKELVVQAQSPMAP